MTPSRPRSLHFTSKHYICVYRLPCITFLLPCLPPPPPPPTQTPHECKCADCNAVYQEDEKKNLSDGISFARRLVPFSYPPPGNCIEDQTGGYFGRWNYDPLCWESRVVDRSLSQACSRTEPWLCILSPTTRKPAFLVSTFLIHSSSFSSVLFPHKMTCVMNC